MGFIKGLIALVKFNLKPLIWIYTGLRDSTLWMVAFFLFVVFPALYGGYQVLMVELSDLPTYVAIPSAVIGTISVEIGGQVMNIFYAMQSAVEEDGILTVGESLIAIVFGVLTMFYYVMFWSWANKFFAGDDTPNFWIIVVGVFIFALMMFNTMILDMFIIDGDRTSGLFYMIENRDIITGFISESLEYTNETMVNGGNDTVIEAPNSSEVLE